ncbi:hypothetical protein O6H91_22G064200 [Diphasiastrum complanatum]|uniref:Uncharacterized protein n=1 Tax=Diphasiastrum complanatum TaxID=34168 RepID=A0ACC2AGL9_DIPCM|nr:hypothetical protein O6H91_22G064200 [Diphasiastrum complanatum]
MGETNEDGDNFCPLCMEEMDLTDRHLRPCHCGYQICVWCWHQIMELAAKDNAEGRCPACRTLYDKEKIVGAASNCEELIDLAIDKKRSHKVKAKALEGRKQLSNVRVVQRNLVYVVGFPPTLTDEENLEKREYFGQYGRILKVAMSRSSSNSGQHSHNGPSASVYITYSREEEALRCIRAVDGCILEGKLLRACFGTNKYCNAWLKNMPCNNPDCLYLHDEGTEEDSFTKEEMLVKYGSKHQHFHELTHPPHRVVGGGLPPPVPEVSATLCNSASSLQQIHHQTPRVPGKPPVSSTVPGKTTSLPAAASWGMRGKTAATKATANSNILKKKSAGLMCVPSGSSSMLSNPSLMGVVPTSAFVVEPNKEEQRACSSLNFRTIKSDALHLAHNGTEGYNVNEQLTSIPESACSSAPSIELNVGDLSISLCSTCPVDVSAVHDDFLSKQDNFHCSSVESERTQNETDKEIASIALSMVVEKRELSEGEILQTSTCETPIGASGPPISDDKTLQVAKPTNAGTKNLTQFRGDNSIISDILTIDFDNDGSFSGPADLAKLLKAGPLNPLIPDSCKDLSVSWKSQSSQSRFSFARCQDHEQLNGRTHFPSSGEYDKEWPGASQTHLPAAIRQIEDKNDVASVKRSDYEIDSYHEQEISTALLKSQGSFARHELLDYRNAAPMHTTELTAILAPLMGTTKARPYAPPGFSTPMKLSSIYPPGFNFENVVGGAVFHGLIDESLAQEGVNLGLFASPIPTPQATDNNNISDVELIDPAIMAVGRGKLPLDVGQIGPLGPLDAGQVLSSIDDSSQFHHLLMQGTPGTNPDPFGFGPRLAVAHRSGISDLLNHQQQRAGLTDGKYYSLPYPVETYPVERHNNDQDVHALSPSSSAIIDGALSSRVLSHREGNFTSPLLHNSAFNIGSNSFLNLTRSSTMGSLQQIGLETSELDAYHPAQRLHSHLRSSPAIGRLDDRPDGSFSSLNLETAFKNIFFSSSKHDSPRINVDRYNFEQPLQSSGSVPRLDLNGQLEFDRRW